MVRDIEPRSIEFFIQGREGDRTSRTWNVPGGSISISIDNPPDRPSRFGMDIEGGPQIFVQGMRR
jgi:hypothetical protein